ncbi:hypothetical protein LINPERPRIM_LOCUS25715 [Linum perenne]
MSLNDVLVF